MDKLKVLQQIGNEICEGCGDDRDCGLEYEDCDRIIRTANILDQWLGIFLDAVNGENHG